MNHCHSQVKNCHDLSPDCKMLTPIFNEREIPHPPVGGLGLLMIPNGHKNDQKFVLSKTKFIFANE